MRRFQCVPTINILGQKKKNIIVFHLKINIFTAVKYCYILHGRVCVMGMAIFPIFLILEEQISVESLVENQKSRLIFI